MLYEENTDWNAWKNVNHPLMLYLLDLALDALATTTHNAKLWKIHSALFYFSCYIFYTSSILFFSFFFINKKLSLVSGCWTMAINLAWAFLYFLVFLVPPTHDITTLLQLFFLIDFPPFYFFYFNCINNSTLNEFFPDLLHLTKNYWREIDNKNNNSKIQIKNKIMKLFFKIKKKSKNS